MAPSVRDLVSGLPAMASLQSRFDCPSGYYYSRGDCFSTSSTWYRWGRWVFLVCLVVICLLVMLALRWRVNRRRRQGVLPAYGTGWLGYGQNPYPPQPYGNAPGFAAPPPPEYSQQPYNNTGGTFDSNQGYYGQTTGTYNNAIPLQQPSHTYTPMRNADDEYAPPEGPPPGKR